MASENDQKVQMTPNQFGAGLSSSIRCSLELLVKLALLGFVGWLLVPSNAMAQSCGGPSNCPGIFWYVIIPIDGVCEVNAVNQYEGCLGGVSSATPGQLLGGVQCCLSQYDLALCACPPPNPPASGGTGSGRRLGPKPGNKPPCGAPVDAGSGSLTYDHTDLELSDVVPIQLSRSYREADGSS